MLAGDAPSGAAAMLAFGLGTLPNLLLLSGLSARLAQWGHARWALHLAAALMLLTGALALYRAASLPDALLQAALPRKVAPCPILKPSSHSPARRWRPQVPTALPLR